MIPPPKHIRLRREYYEMERLASSNAREEAEKASGALTARVEELIREDAFRRSPPRKRTVLPGVSNLSTPRGVASTSESSGSPQASPGREAEHEAARTSRSEAPISNPHERGGAFDGGAFDGGNAFSSESIEALKEERRARSERRKAEAVAAAEAAEEARRLAAMAAAEARRAAEARVLAEAEAEAEAEALAEEERDRAAAEEAAMHNDEEEAAAHPRAVSGRKEARSAPAAAPTPAHAPTRSAATPTRTHAPARVIPPKSVTLSIPPNGLQLSLGEEPLAAPRGGPPTQSTPLTARGPAPKESHPATSTTTRAAARARAGESRAAASEAPSAAARGVQRSIPAIDATHASSSEMHMQPPLNAPRGVRPLAMMPPPLDNSLRSARGAAPAPLQTPRCGSGKSGGPAAAPFRTHGAPPPALLACRAHLPNDDGEEKLQPDYKPISTSNARGGKFFFGLFDRATAVHGSVASGEPDGPNDARGGKFLFGLFDRPAKGVSAAYMEPIGRDQGGHGELQEEDALSWQDLNHGKNEHEASGSKFLCGLCDRRSDAESAAEGAGQAHDGSYEQLEEDCGAESDSGGKFLCGLCDRRPPRKHRGALRTPSRCSALASALLSLAKVLPVMILVSATIYLGGTYLLGGPWGGQPSAVQQAHGTSSPLSAKSEVEEILLVEKNASAL